MSLNKSENFFSPNVSGTEAAGLIQLTGMPQTENLRRYLGVPSIHGRVTKAILCPLLQKISDRLKGWRARHLTLTERLVLVKSVLSDIPYFAMKTIMFPCIVCDEIDKCIRGVFVGKLCRPTQVPPCELGHSYKD